MTLTTLKYTPEMTVAVLECCAKGENLGGVINGENRLPTPEETRDAKDALRKLEQMGIYNPNPKPKGAERLVNVKMKNNSQYLYVVGLDFKNPNPQIRNSSTPVPQGKREIAAMKEWFEKQDAGRAARLGGRDFVKAIDEVVFINAGGV